MGITSGTRVATVWHTCGKRVADVWHSCDCCGIAPIRHSKACHEIRQETKKARGVNMMGEEVLGGSDFAAPGGFQSWIQVPKMKICASRGASIMDSGPQDENSTDS